jgi:hypothetical protein
MIAFIAIAATRPGYFTARCGGRFLCRSRQLLLDGARELFASDYSAHAIVTMTQAGSEVVALPSTIDAAAGLEISSKGTDFVPRRAVRAGPPMRSGEVVASSVGGAR